MDAPGLRYGTPLSPFQARASFPGVVARQPSPGNRDRGAWCFGSFVVSVARPRTAFCAPVFLLLAACASSPADSSKKADGHVTAANAESGQAAAPGKDAPERIQLDLSGRTPLLMSRGDRGALLASNLKLSVDDDLLQYRATYELEPGDILSVGTPDYAPASAPTRFAGQRLGQGVRLQLPEVAGAPLSLDLTTEIRNSWMIAGDTASQREHASLRWSPGRATVNVQWAGAAKAFDSSVALLCDVESTVRLPTHQSASRSQAVQVFGRACVVAADDTPYAGAEAQTWGLGYVWSRAQQESEAVLSVIEPAWVRSAGIRDVEPSYQLGLSHRRDFGWLSAKALVSVRQSSLLENMASADGTAGQIDTTSTDWAANASLTWKLPDASVSANWEQGVDRLWFTPETSQASDRFGLALNLSRWMESFAPDASPQFAMKWNWSRVRLPGDEVIRDNALRLDVALLF